MTAEEFLQYHLEISYFYDDKTEKVVCYSDEVEQAMVEFAKLHVTEALKAANEKVQTKEAWWQDNGSDDGFHYTIVDSDSILSAYPLDLIK
jgi:hypothetical protein